MKSAPIRRSLLTLLVALLLGHAPPPLEASQIANHIRVAHLVYHHPNLPDDLRLILSRNYDAYLAGAAGPDTFNNILGLLHSHLGIPHLRIVADIHYHRTGQLIENLLHVTYEQADPALRERYLAFTLGWVTHYFVDVHEHRLVNRFGGYYAVDDGRHKQLEMFESSHVFTRGEFRDTQPYLAPAAGVPAELVVEGLLRTFPQPGVLTMDALSWDWLNRQRQTRNYQDIALGAGIMQEFTSVTLNQYLTQQGVGGFIETAMGRIPLGHEYQSLMEPLELQILDFGIDPRAAPGDRSSLWGDFHWTVHDDGLTVVYATDWYEANRQAIQAIIEASRQIQAGLWRAPPTFTDYDMDTGVPRSQGDAAARSESAAFRRVEVVELSWAIQNPRGETLVEGFEVIPLVESQVRLRTAYRTVREGSLRLFLPADPSLFHVGNQPLSLRASIRMINNNRQLMEGRHVSAFRFPPGNAPPVEERVTLEAVDVWRSALRMPRLTEDPPPVGEPPPVEPPVEEEPPDEDQPPEPEPPPDEEDPPACDPEDPDPPEGCKADGTEEEEDGAGLTGLLSDGERLRDEALARCDYPAALAHQQRVVTAAEAWVTENFPAGPPPAVAEVLARIRRDLEEVDAGARVVEEARWSLERARERLRDRDPEVALDHLDAARAVDGLPFCIVEPVEALYRQVAADMEAIEQRTREIAQTANEGCDYGTALLALERLEAEVPHLTWLRDEGPRIRELERAQRTARERGTQAQTARQNREWNRAIALAREAAGLAPACERPLIEDFIRVLEREQAAEEGLREGDAGGAQGDPSDPFAGIPVETSVIFLIDTSGSMSINDRIGQARNAASASIRNMPPNVEMALITYDGACTGGWRVVHDFTREREPLLEAVQRLQPGGGTPMAPAVAFAQEYLVRNARGGQGQIMLLSDGQNNCGSVREAGDRLLRSTIPVRLDAVGLDLPQGGQAEADLDELVAASGNGARYSANTANELVTAFRRAFIGQQLRLDDPSQGPEIGATLQDLFRAALDHLRGNDPRSARGSLEEAVRRAPTSPAARYNLSLGYEAEGQLQRAVEQARQYLELSPSSLDRGTVMERVSQLEAQLRETPTGLFDPAACRDLYEWARGQGSTGRDTARRAMVFRIQNLAQRGDCQNARYEYSLLLERFGN